MSCSSCCSPQLNPVVVDSVAVLDEMVVIIAGRDDSTTCAGCGHDSIRPHSHYQRHVADDTILAPVRGRIIGGTSAASPPGRAAPSSRSSPACTAWAGGCPARCSPPTCS